jgi:threonine/homoserine/homoserine lactone efflux protein
MSERLPNVDRREELSGREHMTPHLFLKGIIIGFSIAAPVGPIGVLCIRQSLAEGRGIGLATGLGVATADAAYGCIAGFGLTAVSSVLVRQRVWLGLLGGAFLCDLGVRTVTSRPAEQAAETRGEGLLPAYVSALLLTLTNPMTILSFVAVFAGVGLATSPGYAAASSVVFGVFVGSALWWLFLSGGVGLLRSRVNSTWMRAVNVLSGCVIFAFGLYAVATSLLG